MIRETCACGAHIRVNFHAYRQSLHRKDEEIAVANWRHEHPCTVRDKETSK